MTLTTHILIATAVSKPFYNADPALVFAIAVASHYVADAIPHWDWNLSSITYDSSPRHDHTPIPDKKLILKDLSKITLDIVIGSLIVLAMFHSELNAGNLPIVALSILGGILPDSLQPIFWLWKKKNPFVFLQRFHNFMHAKTLIGYRGLKERKHVIAGILSQIAIGLLSLWIMTL